MVQKIIYNIGKWGAIQKFLFSLLALTIGFLNFFPLGNVLAASDFNTGASDYPLRIGNTTQSSGSLNWATSLNGVNPGDELKFQVYYHNAASSSANNTKVVLSLSPSGSSTNFQAQAQISATGYNTYTSNASINLNQSQGISLNNTAKWYHNYNGSAYQIDDVNVTVSGNTATFNLGGVAPGYAPNDGFIVFSAKVGGTSSSSSNNFNTGASDYPLRVGNTTQSSGSLNWATSLNSVNPGDELKFQVYYHNAASSSANNTKVVLSLSPSGSSTNFQAQAQISATGYNTYTSNASINLNQSQGISLNNTAKWYHNYNGSAYQIDDVNVTVSGNTATFNLGGVAPGYAPNDGFIVFSAKTQTSSNQTVLANAGVDQSVRSGDLVYLNGSASTGTNLNYAWVCNGGISLSNYDIANPTFIAPIVSSGQIYTCALTVTSGSNTSNDTVGITVNPQITSTASSGIATSGTVLGKIINLTENNNGSIVVNGEITECSSKNCKARFIWGDNTNATNQTNWINNLNKGSKFSYPLINLKKGDAYYVGIEVQMGSKTYKTATADLTKFIAKPDKPASFTAKVKNNTNAELSWKLGEGGSKILVKRAINNCPLVTDATAKTVYFGDGQTIIDDALNTNTSYCYRSWMITYDGLQLIYSDPAEALIATTQKAITSTPKTTIPSTSISKTVANQIEKNFSLNISVRNTSIGETQFKKNTTAAPGETMEFNVEVKNTGNAKLENIIVKNLLSNDLNPKSVFVNNISRSIDAIENAYIQELKKDDTFKINFTAVMKNYEGNGAIAIVSEASADGLNSMTDSINIQKKPIVTQTIEEETVEASLFSTIMAGEWFPWSILALIVLVLLIVYFSLKEERKRR
ncbi:MAG TPA: hypothetical protein PKU93_03350 [Candidatus Pacearchaeota archaeon]|nr:hypothetical protein [Candidatus Pacearchaeota archaeon]